MRFFGTFNKLSPLKGALVSSILFSAVGAILTLRGLSDHSKLAQNAFMFFVLGFLQSGVFLPFKTGRVINLVTGLIFLVGLVMILAQFFDYARYGHLTQTGTSITLISIAMFSIIKWWLYFTKKEIADEVSRHI